MDQNTCNQKEFPMLTVEEIYEQTIRPLPTSARLQIATMILNNLPPQAIVDYSEEWSEEDYRDFSAASWESINQTLEHASPKERTKALDAIAEMNKELPVLPEEAYNRASLYDESF